MNDDLKIIKKKYGEQMMHLCRSLFPSLLEQPGLLSNLMLSYFEPSRFLYDDIIKNKMEDDFKNYIYSFVDVERNVIISNSKTPAELLSEAGYILYECKTEEDIQSFRRYYKKGEELCTFNGGRLEKCYVFFAVKKNVEEIKRENFNNPKREDEYGTSVISIQFSKGNVNTLSIKNRYNHSVNNPDVTFSNNLENIISGLTDSFARKYRLNLHNQNNGFELPGYVRGNDGKFYKYNYEINNIYYCSNNIVIDHFDVVDKYADREKYIVADYFIIDLVNKTIDLYDNSINDCFVDGIKDIDKINITKSKETGNKILEIITKAHKKIVIELDKTNRIIGYYNENVIKVGNNFLSKNTELLNLYLPNLKEVGNNFLLSNSGLINLNLPNLLKIGNCFLKYNIDLKNLYLPFLEEVGSEFLFRNVGLSTLSLPNLKSVDNDFLRQNTSLSSIGLPNLVEVGSHFLYKNISLRSLNLPSLIKVGGYFLCFNDCVLSLNLPKLVSVGNNFLYWNDALGVLSLPELVSVGSTFLFKNTRLSVLDLPNLEEVGNKFLYSVTGSIRINLPKVSSKVKVELYKKLQFSFKEISVTDFNSADVASIDMIRLFENINLDDVRIKEYQKVLSSKLGKK